MKKMHKKAKRNAVPKPAPEPYPGFNRELAEREARQRDTRAASAEPLPGPLNEAFGLKVAPTPPNAVIRMFVTYDFVILKALNSPLYQRLVELGKPENERREVISSETDDAEMIFQFTRPCECVKKIFEREGREGFRRVATREVLFNEAVVLPPPFYNLAVLEIVQNLGASYGTAVKYESPQPEGVEVFPTPPARMASAGG